MKKRRELKRPSTMVGKIELAELSKTIWKRQKIDPSEWIENYINKIIGQGRGFKIMDKQPDRKSGK